MRTPTVLQDLYAWWHATLAGLRPPVTNEPHVGFYKRRLVKGGPWVPAVIWLDQPMDDGELIGDERLRCLVNGKERDPEDQWLWLCTHPIAEAEYRYLVSLCSWAVTRAPEDPAANPSVSVDFNNSPVPF